MMGTGTTGIAALKLKRQFLGMEKDMETFEDAKRNILTNEARQAIKLICFFGIECKVL